MLEELVHLGLSAAATPPAFWPALGEAIGLWSRGRRQRAAWTPHLVRTRALIESAMPNGRRDTVAVLGSGPLFDIPLAQLATAFVRVVLIDRAHPFSAQLRARRFGNVSCLWADLSGPNATACLAGIARLDWVVSANLLSQLAVAAPAGAERAAIDRHLGLLSTLNVPVTLVTDTDYVELDQCDRERASLDLLYGATLPPSRHGWSWEVAPFGEEARDLRRVHRVTGFPDWHLAVRAAAEKRFIARRDLVRLRA